MCLCFIKLHYKLKIKFTLEQAIKAQMRSRGIALLFNLHARWEWVVSAMSWPLYPWERNPVPIV
jgi:hypothetical protein